MNVYYIMSWKCFIWHATSTQLRQKLETPQAIYVHGIENKWKRMQKDGREWKRMGSGKPHFILKTLYAMTRLCALIRMPNVGGPFFSVHALSREFSFNLKRVLFPTCPGRHRFLHSLGYSRHGRHLNTIQRKYSLIRNSEKGTSKLEIV